MTLVLMLIIPTILLSIFIFLIIDLIDKVRRDRELKGILEHQQELRRKLYKDTEERLNKRRKSEHHKTPNKFMR